MRGRPPGPGPRFATQRARILDVAIDLFARQGFEATGMRAIADAVGVQPATIYHYFSSKEEMIDALLTESAEALRERIGRTPPGGPLREVVFGAGMGFLRGHSTLRDKQLFEVVLIAAHHRPDWAERYLREVADLGHAELAARIAAALPEGARERVDAEALARIVIGALLSFVLHEEMIRRGGAAAPDREAYLGQIVELVAGGVERAAADRPRP